MTSISPEKNSLMKLITVFLCSPSEHIDFLNDGMCFVLSDLSQHYY